MPDGDENLD